MIGNSRSIRNPILSHVYAGRPLSASHLLPLYLEQPSPRPNLIYLANTNPPTLVYNLTHGNLLFLATSTSDLEPLLVLEFLHRVIDAFEDFLGAPLLAVKIENSYDVVAQLLTEMCDAGMISTTEPNALREVVEIEGWVGKLLGSITLPGLVMARMLTDERHSLTSDQSKAVEPKLLELKRTITPGFDCPCSAMETSERSPHVQ